MKLQLSAKKQTQILKIKVCVIATFFLSACDDIKTNLIANCRVDASKSLPQELDKSFSQIYDNFVKDCMTSKGYRLDGFRDGCPQNTANPELIDQCYRNAFEQSAPQSPNK
jgi:uncharacterized lipoprotein YajG